VRRGVIDESDGSDLSDLSDLYDRSVRCGL